MRYLTLFALLLVLTVSACNKDTVDQQVLIGNYLTDNNITAQMTPEGLHYVITQAGTGESMPTINSRVTMNYTGSLLDGTVFETGNLIDNPLTNLILGWQIGVPLLNKGAKATLYIPSDLGYGSRRVGDIPANSALIFEIELLNFTN